MTPRELIFGMLARRLDLRSVAWLERTASLWHYSPEEKTIFQTFSAAIRHSGKGALAPQADESKAAHALVPGWDPADWTLDQAVRIYLLLSLPDGPASAPMLESLYQTSDLGESLALMKSLPLLADPTPLIRLAQLGARSNVKSQFEAIALRNPYPMHHFDESAWNQMISKAIFIDAPLMEIQGLENRANPRLDRILLDLVQERRAAGRDINPLLYRCLGPASREALAAQSQTQPHAEAGSHA